MPFQDVEEVEPQIRRTPTAFERWLRRMLFEDWGLKLLAVAVTIVLWMAVSGQNKPITQRSVVQLNFLRPDGMEISNDLPEGVEVTLKGSQAKLDELGPRLLATVDITDQKPGERVLRLVDRLQMALPPGVTIQGTRPTTIAIRLEPIVEEQRDVEVKFEGKLAEGYELAGFTTIPGRVRLRGPSSRIKALQKATTESVLLDGRQESFNLTDVAISVPDPKIDILDPTVDIHVEITRKKGGEANRRFVSNRSWYLAGVAAPSSRQ